MSVYHIQCVYLVLSAFACFLWYKLALNSQGGKMKTRCIGGNDIYFKFSTNSEVSAALDELLQKASFIPGSTKEGQIKDFMPKRS